MAVPVARRPAARALLNKVPEITIWFWIIKVLATTVGETAADFLSETLKLGLTNTMCITAVLLAAALTAQMRARRYVPPVYWVTVVLISIAGTLITDKLGAGRRESLGEGFDAAGRLSGIIADGDSGAVGRQRACSGQEDEARAGGRGRGVGVLGHAAELLRANEANGGGAHAHPMCRR